MSIPFLLPHVTHENRCSARANRALIRDKRILDAARNTQQPGLKEEAFVHVLNARTPGLELGLRHEELCSWIEKKDRSCKTRIIAESISLYFV